MATVALPDIDLDGRIIILTGADRGLGRAMALALAEKGARLTLVSNDAEGVRAITREIEGIAGKGHALGVETDITDLAACENCLKRTLDVFGGLDVLVNNARRLHRGPGIPASGNNLPFWETDPEIYKQTVAVNVTGTFFMARTAANYFLVRGAGKIINLTTSLRNFFRERQSPYGVTKVAIDASTYIWAEDMKDKGITVNALLPGGACDSDPNRPPQSGRKLLPVDVMNPVLVWLCSSRSDGHTGDRYNGSLWDASLDVDTAALGCREEPSIRGAGT
jgi:NAD(P)-dependent dehydrogenase (short-subunit alcohol dehydrogenase family)